MQRRHAVIVRYTLRQSAIVTLRGILCFVVVFPALSGCARMRTRYNIGVTTYLSHDLSFPPTSSSIKIAVVTSSEPSEVLLEAEVKRKIERLVRGRGFGTADVDGADYILSAFFAIDAGNAKTGATPVYQGGGVSTTRIYTNTGQWATGTTYHPGTTSYVPYSYTQFTRFLGISVYEKQRWLASTEEDLSDAIVWSATTTSAGSSSDLRSVIDYLLVETFDYFGQDTGERRRKTLFKNDKRVRELRDGTTAPEAEK